MKVATIETNKGTIRVRLEDDKVPKTVENFEKLVKRGLLRRAQVPSRDRRFHGPDRMSPGDGNRWAGLQIR